MITESVANAGASSVASAAAGGQAAGYGSGLVGGIIDAFTGPVMSNVNYIRSKRVSNRQMGAARWMAENAPSWAVDGMRKAGINPILAYMKNLPSGEVPSMRGDPNSGTDLSSAFSRGVSTAKQMQLLESQVDAARAEADRARVDADTLPGVRAADINVMNNRAALDAAAAARERAVTSATQALEASHYQNVEASKKEQLRRQQSVPWSPEQKDWIRSTPLGEGSRAIKRGAAQFLESIRSSARPGGEHEGANRYRRQEP